MSEKKSSSSPDENAPLTARGSAVEPVESAVSTQGDITQPQSQQQEPQVTELVRAAQLGNVNELRELIENGSYTAQDISPDGTTALHWAAINNRMAACKYLIEQGAEVDYKGGELQATPLHWACRNGLVYIAHLLIQHGADPLRTDSQGFNALHLAVHSSNVLLVIYLLHQSMPVDTPDPAGRTAAHWAAYQGDALSIDCLLNWGANVKITDTLGFTALHWSIVRGNKMCIKRLIEEGSDVFAKSNDGKSPHIMAEEMRTVPAFQGALAEAGRLPNGSVRPKFLTKKAVDLITFLTPFVVLPLIFMLFHYFPVLLGVPLCLALVIGTMMVLKRFILPNAYFGHTMFMQSPLLAGVFAGSCFLVMVRYLFFILPATLATAPLLNVAFTATFATVIYCFFRAMLMDPGYVPKPLGVTEQRRVIEELIERGEYDSRHFCMATYVRKPLRAKYDRFSKRVVARFDHVCPWVNNVIGVRNHRVFLIYVISLFIGIPLLDALYFNSYASVLAASTSECPFAPEFLCGVLTEDYFSTYTVAWATAQLTWVTLLVFVQLIQIARGMTTNEASNLHKFGFMGADDFSSLPLDHHSLDTATAPGEVTAFKSAKKRRCHSTLARILGVDQFVNTAQEAFGKSSRHPAAANSNPVDYGVMRNCADFWFPDHSWNIFKIYDRGYGGLNGNMVDYYELWEFPKKRQSDYEMVAQQV
ncbi:hypothetical protein TRICI_000392 [Trichomonascus ciferrii]|uniref:Palmitoyltransferase n=1 Tax=Trichomonascus ciferrii TaxID=44093 RepID=A0A642VDI3_9ASCO|nr:hypothetical protein TRICI_000392 [Trichomonascus ciferrii]